MLLAAHAFAFLFPLAAESDSFPLLFFFFHILILIPALFADKLSSITSMVGDTSKAQIRNFIIKPWDRDPVFDLFIGNNVGNCLSIGEKNTYPAARLPGVPGRRWPAGVLDYLVDKGIQVVEILKEKEAPAGKNWYAGQCFLFIFLNNGKPVLMVDSIEIHPYYRKHALNLKIREALFG